MLDKFIRFMKPNRPQTEPSLVSAASADEAYQAKIRQEIGHFSEVTNVHALPEIFGYWSNKYLAPMLRECGLTGVDEFYAKYLVEAARRSPIPPRFISIGSGNCDTEIRVAKLIKEMGIREFAFDCLELNPYMLERGRQDAIANGLDGYFSFVESDFNAWVPNGQYSGVMANHSLHHVTNLEGLFDGIKSSLHPQGYFVTGDMIGRNGHQRWPEAMAHVDEFWKQLPDSYRYNQLLKRHEPAYINWDCSSEGFEGIRAQDILPLLIERFDFPLFLGFSNVIGPFIDRCFGHNFDANSAADRALIDKIHEADEQGFRDGTLKPTQMFAVMSPMACESHIYARGLSPQMSVRDPTSA